MWRAAVGRECSNPKSWSILQKGCVQRRVNIPSLRDCLLSLEMLAFNVIFGWCLETWMINSFPHWFKTFSKCVLCLNYFCKQCVLYWTSIFFLQKNLLRQIIVLCHSFLKNHGNIENIKNTNNCNSESKQKADTALNCISLQNHLHYISEAGSVATIGSSSLCDWPPVKTLDTDSLMNFLDRQHFTGAETTHYWRN